MRERIFKDLKGDEPLDPLLPGMQQQPAEGVPDPKLPRRQGAAVSPDEHRKK